MPPPSSSSKKNRGKQRKARKKVSKEAVNQQQEAEIKKREEEEEIERLNALRDAILNFKSLQDAALAIPYTSSSSLESEETTTEERCWHYCSKPDLCLETISVLMALLQSDKKSPSEALRGFRVKLLSWLLDATTTTNSSSSSTGDEDSYDKLSMLICTATNTTSGENSPFEKLSKLVNFEKLSKLKSVLIYYGTSFLLRNRYYAASFVARAILILESPDDWLEHGREDRDLIGDHSNKTVTRFYADRVTCDCLKEMWSSLKHQPKLGVCYNCKESVVYMKLKKCSNCRLVHYCNRQCQVEDWPDHKSYCHPLGKVYNERIQQQNDNTTSYVVEEID